MIDIKVTFLSYIQLETGIDEVQFLLAFYLPVL
jgi:hypothetical protein